MKTVTEQLNELIEKGAGLHELQALIQKIATEKEKSDLMGYVAIPINFATNENGATVRFEIGMPAAYGLVEWNKRKRVSSAYYATVFTGEEYALDCVYALNFARINRVDREGND